MGDSKSTSRFVFTLGGAAVSWKSYKETVLARSVDMNVTQKTQVRVGLGSASGFIEFIF